MLIGLIGCATMPKVTRTEVSEQVDLSGNWNDTDSQLVSAEMIKDALSRPWVDEFLAKKKTKPTVIVGTVLNKSHEHINTQTFVKDLERELINSNKVRFVASRAEREEVREERKDQQLGFTEATTVKDFGKEIGADYMLKGQINTIFDEAGKIALKYYQVELELIDLESNEKTWIGQKKIKKIVKRPGSRL
ncbi:MAG: penicillin-binding protein activator LpoB [Elusimicrobiota bacterium]|nr:penicillin-binding protein activator LpoB [Elusimicrobiota bacterium]